MVAQGTPGDGVGVVGLHLLSGPDVGTLDVEEDLALSDDNDFHNDIVQQSTL